MKLQINNLTKIYGKKKALNDFNCVLENGVYGLLGPNGAGKTTLINIIVGILPATSGEIIFDGQKIGKSDTAFLNQLGFLPQYPRFYKNYKANEFLKYIATLKGIPAKEQKERIYYLLEVVNLTDVAEKKIGSFSGGMRQRLGIAQAMLNNPSLLILDEPTAGLDPKERIRFRNLISRLSGDRTIILATHIVSDIEYIANEVILLGNGTKIAQNNPADLMDSIKGKVWEVVISETKIQSYMQNQMISNVVRREDGYHVRIISNKKPSEDAVPTVPTLEDVYLYHFGEEEYT